MERREFLIGASTATLTSTLLAGCTGSSDDGEENDYEGSDGDDGGSEDGSSSENESAGEGGDVENEVNPEDVEPGEDLIEYNGLEILSHEFVEDDYSAAIEGAVANNSGDRQNYLEVSARVYNADGQQLDTYFTNTTDLDDGVEWAFEVMVLDYEEVEDYDIRVSDSPF